MCKGKEKITKIWISWEQKELFRASFIVYKGLLFGEKINSRQTLMQAVFLRRWLLLGARKSAPKKLNYFTVAIYIITRIAAKLRIFTHSTSTNLPWLAKASTQYYMYTICRPVAAFYECLIEVVIAPHLTTIAQKNCCITPW